MLRRNREQRKGDSVFRWSRAPMKTCLIRRCDGQELKLLSWGCKSDTTGFELDRRVYSSPGKLFRVLPFPNSKCNKLPISFYEKYRDQKAFFRAWQETFIQELAAASTFQQIVETLNLAALWAATNVPPPPGRRCAPFRQTMKVNVKVKLKLDGVCVPEIHCAQKILQVGHEQTRWCWGYNCKI